MTSDGTNAFAYDAENRLVNYNSGAATYVYGPDGLRIQKTVASDITTYIFSGFKVIAEYTGSTPALSQEYIYAGASLLATLDSSGTPAYRHMDHLSARLETDAGGSVTRTFGHFPYGETWYETGAASRQKFTTYERDGESQLDYANARSFIPRLGRFLTADPLAGSIGDPQTLGRYAYTAGDPINLSDPTGMQTCDSANTIEQKAACLLANQDGPSGGGGGWGGCAPWDASCSSSGFSYYNPNYAPSSAEQAYSAGVDWIFYVTSQGCKFTYGGSITCNGKVTPPSEFQAGFDAYLARFGYMNTGFTINRTVVDKGYCNIYCHYIFNTPDAARTWNSAATWGNTAAGLTFAVVGANGALVATPALVTSYQLGQGALLNPTVLEFGTDAISGMTPATAVPATWGGFAGATTGEAFTYAVCRWGDRC